MVATRKLEFGEDFGAPEFRPRPVVLEPLLSAARKVAEKPAGGAEGARPGYRRFEFTECFDDQFASDQANESAPPTPEAMEQALEQARADAEEAFSLGETAGYERGLQKAREEAAAMQADALGRIADALPELLEAAGGQRDAFERDAARLACAVVRSIAPSLAARLCTRQIEAFVVDCLRAALPSPTVEIWLAPEDLPGLEDRIASLAVEAGLQNGVSVQADASLASGAVRVAWSGGGASFDQTAALRKALQGLDTALASLGKD